MLQRIQTVWLLLVILLTALTFKLPFYVGSHAATQATYKLTATESKMLLLVTTLIILTAIAAVSLYKKRRQQLMLCMAGVILEAVLVFLYYSKKEIFVSGSGSYTLWALIHIVNIFLFLLAARNINKDEKLVQDSDRLR